MCRRSRLLWVALLSLVFVAGCSGKTKPEDISVATDLCAKHGGFDSVARYEYGKTLIMECKDGLHLTVRLPDVTP